MESTKAFLFLVTVIMVSMGALLYSMVINTPAMIRGIEILVNN